MKSSISDSLRSTLCEQLAAHGTLRVAVNMSNFLLVSTSNSRNEPDGVSPAMARAIAEELGVTLSVIPFDGPGQIADAASTDQWDLANIAAEPARAQFISFSPAYCEIQATYLLPPGSPISSLLDVDQPGHRIAIKGRSAYDLWLTDNLKHATLERAASLDESFELFEAKQLHALAGLRPKLVEQQKLMPNSVLLDESFTSVQQSIGCQPGKPEASLYLAEFVEKSKKNGLIARLIQHYGVEGRLSVAA